MPRGKRPLHNVSAKHANKRLRDDAVGFLTGFSNADRAQISSAHVDTSETSSVHHADSSKDIATLLHEEPPLESPEISACATTSDVEPGRSENHAEQTVNIENLLSAVNKLNEECEICLLCLCGADCPSCVHNDNGCHHCTQCSDGEIWESDGSIVSSDDEDEDSDDNSADRNDFRTKLAIWAINYGIKEDALRDLITLLKSNFNAELPTDPRTLKHTPNTIKVRTCAPGLYWHAGLKTGLELLDLGDIETIELDFSIDGVPLAKSSQSCFWPILCRVNATGSIFLAGAYHGHKKPNDSNDFFKDFIEEMISLCTDGFHHKGFSYKVKPGRFICDAPAKSFGLNCTGHTGYWGCTKCTEEGVYICNRVVFPMLNLPLRTHNDFINMTQEQHHHMMTILSHLPDFDLVSDVVLDYMHLVLLGVCRKQVNLWISGKIPYRLQSRVLHEISKELESLRSFIPREYNRKTRSFDDVKFWKATEWRTFLFLVGPVVLAHLRRESRKRYDHFLVLHVAMTILASKSLYEHYGSEYPNELLISYVKGFAALYGQEQLSHNLHNLVHLAQDVKKHGVVDNFSAFPFENFLQKVKKLIRKGDKPLQQLARRYEEIRAVQCYLPDAKKSDHNVVYSGKHTRGPLFRSCCDPQYTSIQFKDFCLDLLPANRCCGLLDGSVVEIRNIAFCPVQKCMVIIGRFYQTKSNLYVAPLPSSHLGIWKVKKLSLLMCWPVKLISCKYVCLPYEDGHAAFPMLHVDRKTSQLSK